MFLGAALGRWSSQQVQPQQAAVGWAKLTVRPKQDPSILLALPASVWCICRGWVELLCQKLLGGAKYTALTAFHEGKVTPCLEFSTGEEASTRHRALPSRFVYTVYEVRNRLIRTTSLARPPWKALPRASLFQELP